MKKILLICISMLGLSACEEGTENTEASNKKVFYGLDFFGGNDVNVKTYRIDTGILSEQSSIPLDKTYLSESNRYYFSDQGVPTLKQTTNQNFIWGKQASLKETTTQAVLSFAPTNLRKNETLTVEYHLKKMDLTGLSFDIFAQNKFFYQLYNSNGDKESFGDPNNHIIYAIAFTHFEDKFPLGSVCWKIVETRSNKDYIIFDQTKISNQTVDGTTLLKNQGVWNGTAWQVIDTSNLFNTFFKIGNQQYLGRYISKKSAVQDVAGELQCDYLNETATNALLTKYKQVKL
ncbi:hypothetical protein MMO38_13660 [Acinetobacter sp. NIPH 1852]|uniref:hypothetical protein n=1 Tax=Acinetobacter sp. NIPH 1852 TaxID=2923428 RepID=UPI001B54C723|nr:hypothetical protein [Acinetobacter sp. NIPH 1852]MBP7880496.1 hypothetical protein [Acinetobacter sp.]MCH7309168.1 hypothetical protein [Acinetobacter sp. NIPH 1852]